MKPREYITTFGSIVLGLVLAAAALAEWLIIGLLVYCWFT